MKQHPYDPLSLPNGAKFLFTPCPGTKGPGIAESISELKGAGADAVVTTLSDSEMAVLNVSELGNEIQHQNLQWFQLSIEDDCAPETAFFTAFNAAKPALMQLLEDKATLAIHCRGGSGRTGLMAAILLLESGESWDEVEPLIKSVRPKALSLPVHVNFLQQHYSI